MLEYKKDDLITVEIEDMGVDGEGIGKAGGFTFFIKDALVGDKVTAKIMKVKKGYAYARLIDVIEPSKSRIEPVCPYHRQCGGCQIQALDYNAQLSFKEKKVRNNLVRIGGFSAELLDKVMEPIIGMETPYRYRNKAQFPIGRDKNGDIVTGFYAGRTHTIIPNTDCALGVAENKIILEILLEYMKKCDVEPYDETAGTGLVRHVLIRKGFTSGEIMVCVVINGDRLPHEDRLVAELTKIEGMASISININKERTNVIMGGECRTIWGRDTITDVIHMRNVGGIDAGRDSVQDGITFAISPLSFYQVNPVQTEKLYSIALEYAGLTGTETVWDLYCGIGTISLFMAKKAKQVYGIEIIEQAVNDARENARRNGIENVRFYAGKAEEVLPRLYAEEGIRSDVICVDPPRKGCDAACLETIVKMSPERVVYVSCDSATLARDLKYLCGKGYEVRKARAVDMFGGTVHVETCVLLSQRHIDDYIRVSVDLEPDDVTPAETKATYDMIKKYGLELGEKYNKSKKWDAKVPICPAEKEKMIVAALRHFQMIS